MVVRRRRSRTIPSRGKKFDLTDWRSSRIPTSGDFRRPLEGSSGPNLSRNSGGLSPRSWRAWCKTSWRLPKLLQTRFREARTALRWSTRWSKKASSRRKIGPRRPRWRPDGPGSPKDAPRRLQKTFQESHKSQNSLIFFELLKVFWVFAFSASPRSKTAQEAPKIVPRRPKRPPRERPDGPRRPQDGPRGLQDGLRRPQERPKRAPRGGAGTNISGSPPKETPRRPQEAPGRPPRGLQEAPRSLEKASRKPPEAPKRAPRLPKRAPGWLETPRQSATTSNGQHGNQRHALYGHPLLCCSLARKSRPLLFQGRGSWQYQVPRPGGGVPV